MKKIKLAYTALFSFIYAVFFSLGLTFLYHLIGIVFSILLENENHYPRLTLFCLLVELCALIAIIIAFVFNLKVSKKYEFSKKLWAKEIIFSIFISIPLIKLWVIIFKLLSENC